MQNSVSNDIKLIEQHFNEIILDSQIEIGENSISWPNYIAGISKNLYAKEYEELRDKRQYSLILKNYGLIHLFYSFSEGNISKVKLAYYPYPVKLKEDDSFLEKYTLDSDDVRIGEYYFDLFNIFKANFGQKVSDKDLDSIRTTLSKYGQREVDALEEKFNQKYIITNSSHLRFDYDPEVKSHNKFEIQYGGIQNVRLPISKVISPFLFMDFIAKCEFNEWHLKIEKKAPYIAAYKAAIGKSFNVSGFSSNNIYLNHD